MNIIPPNKKHHEASLRGKPYLKNSANLMFMHHVWVAWV